MTPKDALTTFERQVHGAFILDRTLHRPKRSNAENRNRNANAPTYKMNLDCSICRVRTWQITDREALARHADNPKVAVNLRDRFPSPYTLADADAWLKLASETEPESNFAIDVEGVVVGGIGFEILDDFDRCSAEIGYWLGESYWGRGLAAAALRAVTEYAFEQHNLTRIFAIPFAGNERSRKVLEKTGYTFEGIMRRSVRKRGIVIDAALYAVTRE